LWEVSLNDACMFLIFLSSISRFTAVFSPEKEKSSESFSRSTRGKRRGQRSGISHNAFLYSEASCAIFAPHGNPSHIIFATLSKHSPAASSRVCQIISSSKRLFQ
jgi:hypothetical protein